MVTDRILTQMEQGIIPWRKPWNGLGGLSADQCAISYVSRKPYSLLNQWLLGEPGEYLTFKQMAERGGRLKPGEKSKIVVYYQMLVKEDKDRLDENGKPKVVRIPFLKYYNVWHLNQIEGIESKLVNGEEPVKPETTLTPNERAEEIINGYLMQASHPKLIIKRSNEAYYRPSTDEVVVPLMEQYDCLAEYYSTTFHELVHSTGHKDRCNRKGITDLSFFESHEYSKEELVAETGAAMLVFQSGIDSASAFKNSVAYLQSWMRELKKDPKMIVWAAGKAEKAVKWILGIEDKTTEQIADAIIAENEEE